MIPRTAFVAKRLRSLSWPGTISRSTVATSSSTRARAIPERTPRPSGGVATRSSSHQKILHAVPSATTPLAVANSASSAAAACASASAATNRSRSFTLKGYGACGVAATITSSGPIEGTARVVVAVPPRPTSIRTTWSPALSESATIRSSDGSGLGKPSAPQAVWSRAAWRDSNGARPSRTRMVSKTPALTRLKRARRTQGGPPPLCEDSPATHARESNRPRSRLRPAPVPAPPTPPRCESRC